MRSDVGRSPVCAARPRRAGASPTFTSARKQHPMNAFFPKQAGAPVPSVEPQGRPIISFEGVSKIFPSRGESAEVVAVHDIHLHVPQGSLVWVIRRGARRETSPLL